MSLFVTGIAGTGSGQYFTDQNSAPILLKADTVWGLPQMAGLNGGATTYQTDIANYCSTRAGQGFNAFLIAVVGNSTTSQGGGPQNGNTWDGVAPFTSPGVLNSTYWTRIDYLLTQAQDNGLTVVFNVAPQYSMDQSGVAFSTSWTDANYTAYGTAIGNRYKTYPNIIWTCADDYFGTFDGYFTDVKTAIQAAGDTHLWSIENYSESTSRFDIYNNTVLPWGTSNAQYNYCYSYAESYLAIEYAFTESSPICVIHGDGYYDADEGGNELPFLRNWAWWTFSSGARGMIYGREAIWPWTSTSLSDLTTGLFDSTTLQTIFTTFSSLPGWNRLVPDTGSALVTAGRGTRATQIPSGGGGTEYTPSSTQNTYVTASKTPDGTLAVIYIPAANSTTITVAGSLMRAPYTATWIDPASGAATVTPVASTYTRSTANSASGHDWVLALQTQPRAHRPSACDANTQWATRG